MSHLYDGEQPEETHLFDDVETEPRITDDLLHRDMIVVQPMKPYETPYGAGTVPDGDASYCYCSFEPRITKTSTFSKNWAQDTTPQSTGGLREDALAIVLAPEWHGDFYSRFWFNGSCYEVDGSPVYLPHSSDMAKHYEFPARRIYAAELAHNRVSPPVPPEGAETWGM